jgi:hypothetical protein
MDLQILVRDAAAAGERSFSVAVNADQGPLQVGAEYPLMPTYPPATPTAPGYAEAVYSDSGRQWVATTGHVVIDAIDWQAYHSSLLVPVILHLENASFAPSSGEGDRSSTSGTFMLDIEGSAIALASGSR